MCFIPEVNGAVWLGGDDNTEPSDICRLVGEHDDDVLTGGHDQVDAVCLADVSTARSGGARHQSDEVLDQVAVVERN